MTVYLDLEADLLAAELALLAADVAMVEALDDAEAAADELDRLIASDPLDQE